MAQRRKFLPCSCGWSCPAKALFCSNCGKKTSRSRSASPPASPPRPKQSQQGSQAKGQQQQQRGGSAQAALQDSAERIKKLEAENKRLRQQKETDAAATPSDTPLDPGAAEIEQQVARHQAMVDAIGKIPAASRSVTQQTLFDESVSEAARLRASLAKHLPFDVQHSRVSTRVRRKKEVYEKALKHHTDLSEKLAALLVDLDAATERVEGAKRAVDEAEAARRDLLSRTPLSELPDQAVGEELQDAFLHVVQLAREKGLEEQLGGQALDTLAAAAAKLAAPRPPGGDVSENYEGISAAEMAVDEDDGLNDDELLGAAASVEAQQAQNGGAAGSTSIGPGVVGNSWGETARKRGLEVADKLESITRRRRLSQKAPPS